MTSRRWARAAAAAIVLALVASCTSNTAGPGPNVSPTGSAPGTISPGATPTGTGVPSVTGSPRPGTTGGSFDARALPMPRIGTYEWATQIDLGAEGQYSGRRLRSYFPPSITDDAAVMVVRQITEITGSQPKEWWMRYQWRADGLYLVTELQPTGAYCRMSKPFLEYPYALKVGRTWRSESTCENDGTRWKLDARVVRETAVRVEGQRVPVFEISRELTRAAPGANPPPLLETHWYAPSLRIPARMRTRGGGSPLDLVDTLKRRNPGPLPSDTPPEGF